MKFLGNQNWEESSNERTGILNMNEMKSGIIKNLILKD